MVLPWAPQTTPQWRHRLMHVRDSSQKTVQECLFNTPDEKKSEDWKRIQLQLWELFQSPHPEDAQLRPENRWVINHDSGISEDFMFVWTMRKVPKPAWKKRPRARDVKHGDAITFWTNLNVPSPHLRPLGRIWFLVHNRAIADHPTLILHEEELTGRTRSESRQARSEGWQSYLYHAESGRKLSDILSTYATWYRGSADEATETAYDSMEDFIDDEAQDVPEGEETEEEPEEEPDDEEDVGIVVRSTRSLKRRRVVLDSEDEEENARPMQQQLPTTMEQRLEAAEAHIERLEQALIAYLGRGFQARLAST